MSSSNKPIKQPMKKIVFIALAAGIGIIFAVFLSKGVSAYAGLISVLGNKVVRNQAQVVEAIPPAPQGVSLGKSLKDSPLPERPEAVLPPPLKEVTLNFVGDIMLDRSVKKSVEKNYAGDYNALFENVGDLANADILFGNLEGPVSTGGRKSGSVYSFRMSPESLSALEGAGFDVLNIANNHIGDWGDLAFADTLDAIVSNGLKYTGGGWNKKEAMMPVIIEKNGISVGFLGFTDAGPTWLEAKDEAPGIMMADDPDFDQIVQNASNQVDILIVSFHFGEEYKKYNKRQENLAHKAIDSGAKIVVGAHPHVIQAIEEYNDGLIAYSLGNFIFDQKFSQETMEGLLLEVTVNKSGLKNYSKKLIKLNDFFQPQIPTSYVAD